MRQSSVVLLAVAAAVFVGHLETTTAGPPITNIYVNPNGNDAHSGKLAEVNAQRTDGPLATLAAARDAVRRLRTAGRLPGPVKIIVAGGTYTIEEPLVLTPQDSGTAAAPITYAAAKGATPIFCGGRTIEDWQEGPDGVWTAKIPDMAADGWYFEQLFVNGRRATRARTPNQFYFYIQDVYEEVIEAGSPRQHKKAKQTVVMRAQDFPVLAELSSAELRDVNLMLYHKWDNTRRFVDALDHQQQAMITSGRGMKSWNAWHRNTRYHLDNFLTALDAPGEWFLARNGTLY